ncbi:uncharacterized protein LOC125801098 isoform X1 [Astyanax mexicanus]|uniref:uncharacterized protein LOC125801098 isoform X1 n=1 Tax=Astyanax mexicanus TaxID=7994 RepID=UPI0020CB251B|nr:uncharacterized protein LOC125801098 isoform X1 [Astyanax mexicanus]XP_049332873.1 uncharacterized protein LOC125801098 isoform X1 [Astyanax mexicanus]XP_049332874.1 uncharacterized protein LOC125801098 isoform X1 [Astyanax mexicanus]XP_049332876.1 uncharacterized protein LOC125801098 isoform X1 [Astyanax mexicanus]XP_049332877.1 uncharacterized protein LOC125801098 isoform X1 [Astyanax mexicanus]XP_049332878.1 uncharacterized protein LOC125801098 isoform X1 [Astyanax mexicanus]
MSQKRPGCDSLLNKNKSKKSNNSPYSNETNNNPHSLISEPSTSNLQTNHVEHNTALNPFLLEMVNEINGSNERLTSNNEHSSEIVSNLENTSETPYNLFSGLSECLTNIQNALIEHNTTLNPFLLEMVNEINEVNERLGSIDEHRDHELASNLENMSENLSIIQTALTQHNTCTALNPFLMEMINEMNESMTEPQPCVATVPSPINDSFETSQELLQQLNQSLLRLNEILANMGQDSHILPSSPVNENVSNSPSPSTDEIEYIHTLNNCNEQQPEIHQMPSVSEGEQMGFGRDDQPGHVLDPNIVINRIDNFNTTEIRRRINFSSLGNVDSFGDFYNYVLEVLNRMLEVGNAKVGPRDVVHVEIQGESLNVSSRVEVINGNIELDSILTMIEKSIQSRFEILSDETIELVIRIVHAPHGGTRNSMSKMFNSDVVQQKIRHLYVFDNRDNLCFALSVSKLLNPEQSDYQIEQNARQLQSDVGLSVNDTVSFADITRFEQKLNCKIVVLFRTTKVKKGYSFFQTTKTPHSKTLFLFLHKNHYYGVKNLKAVLGTTYVCSYCYAGFNDKKHHKCDYHCNVCLDSECPKRAKQTVQCKDCLRICRSQYCFQKHKSQNGTDESLCKTRFYCTGCNTLQDRGSKKHECRKALCRHCGAKIESNFDHQCFMEPLKREQSDEKYIFYDFESNQETGYHVANYICCIDFKGNVWSAEGTDCVSAFFKKFRRNKYKGYTFIAHNARGYDSYILLNRLVVEGVTPCLIAQGGKILCFEDKKFDQRYIDSLSFLPMKLSAIPKAMGFTAEKKGYFPHFWNTQKNQNYVGPYPHPEFYGVDSMMSKERDEFFEWYKTLDGKVFDFKQELVAYCQNDVRILRMGCMAFRNEILSSTGVDPFKCITIASVCLKIFRTNFLPENMLTIPPLDNYINRQKSFSTPAIQWLEYISDRDNIPIQHALNEGEVKIGNYFVDGYFEDGGVRKAFEFLGCFYHGCDKCFPSNLTHPLSKTYQTFGEILQQSLEKIQILQNTHNLHVTVIWEHTWNEMKRSNHDVKKFLDHFDFPERMKPRDALFGGRTNALHLHYVAQPGERIDYYDFTSLYPYVNKTKRYPVGHPTIIFRNFKPLEDYFGLMRLKILPPKGLWAPVLPFRVKSKLLFPLCRMCAELQQQICNHTDEERALTGTWASIEVLKALEKGYRVLKVFEIWHFPNQTDELFADYIKMFLKTKQESSGYPSWVVDEVGKKEYVEKYRENEGIELDPSHIVVNPAKRSVAKLALNSLWGKMCQRSDRSNTTLIQDPSEFLQYMFSDVYDVSHFSFLNKDVAMVQWRYSDERFLKPSNANVFIGIFTTAYARLELYNLMDRLQQRCLYTDTDSVIFKSQQGDWMPPLGDYLGGLTSELDAGDQIVEFVSGGPKTYGYRTLKGKSVMKVKGITLNYTNAQYVNLKSLTELVDKTFKNPDCDAEIMTSYNQIVKDKRGFHLKNKPQKKRFRVVYDKRILLPDLTTLPYGY